MMTLLTYKKSILYLPKNNKVLQTSFILVTGGGRGGGGWGEGRGRGGGRGGGGEGGGEGEGRGEVRGRGGGGERLAGWKIHSTRIPEIRSIH